MAVATDNGRGLWLPPGAVTNAPRQEYARAGSMTTPNRIAAASIPRGAQGDIFGEVGTSGLRQYGGFVQEEWLADLRGRRAAWAYREIADNSPVVGAIMFAIRMLARKVDWRVEGDKEGTVEFIESCMDDMQHTWDDFISEALSFLVYGWSLHEIVYKRRRGRQPRTTQRVPETEEETNYEPGSSEYDDGKIGWRKLAGRAQETLLRWEFNGYSALEYMEQVDWHGGQHRVPIEKALLFRTETTRNNPEGRSFLRNAFTSYYSIKNIQAIEAIGIERDLAGLPVAIPPEGVNLFGAGNEELLARVQALVSGVRRDENEGVVLPEAGWQLILLTTGGARQIDTDAVIRRYRQEIAASVLADFVLVGLDSIGSYAMVDVKQELFGVAVDAVLDLICQVLNRYAIPRLLEVNGIEEDEPPLIDHSSAGRLDLEVIGKFLYELSTAGAPIPWSKELMEQILGEAGLPATFDGELLKPLEGTGSPGEEPRPGEQNGREPAKPEDGKATKADDADPLGSGSTTRSSRASTAGGSRAVAKRMSRQHVRVHTPQARRRATRRPNAIG